MKVLYLLSASADEDQFLTSCKNTSISEIHLCPLEYGCESRLERIIELCKKQSIPVKTINSLELINQNAFKLKDQYIQWIHDISETKLGHAKNLKEFYQFDDGKASGWWLSLIYEKNPYKSDSFIEYVKIVTILDLIKSLQFTSLWADRGFKSYFNICRQSDLNIHFKAIFADGIDLKNNDFIMFVYERFRHLSAVMNLFRRVIQVKFSLKNFKQRMERLQKTDVLAVTMFPLIDWEALKKDKFINRAYGLLTDELKSAFQQLTWLAMFTQINQAHWNQALKAANQLNQKEETIIFYEEFIGLKTFWKILYTDAAIMFKTLFYLRPLSKLFDFNVHGLRISGWPIFKKDFFSSFAGKELFVELGMYYAFDKAVQSLPDRGTVCHFTELHAWENALELVCRKRPSIKSVGLQHTIMPLLLLNYFRDPRELKNNGSTFDDSPQPGYLGTTGNVTKGLLEKNGWNKNKLFVLGAFRFPEVLKWWEEKSNPIAQNHQIIVALSISDKENAEILKMLKDAFKDNELRVKVLLKPHPCHNLPALIRKLQLNLDDRFEITDKPLSAAVAESKAMLVKESSSIFEALARNIPVIIPQLYSIADLCPLSGLLDIPGFVWNAQELNKRIKDILQNKDTTFKDNNVESFLKDYLQPLNKNIVSTFKKI